MRFQAFIVIGVLICIAGCTLETTQPLSDPTKAKLDESIYGHWVQKAKDGPEVHIFIGKHEVKDNPQAIMESAMISWDPKNLEIKVDPKAYFTVTRLGNSSYLNLLRIGSEKAPGVSLQDPGSYKEWATNEMRWCQVFRYACDGKVLRVWTVKDAEKSAENLVKAKQLETKNGRITAESLVKYLEDNGGEELFSAKVLELQKVP